MKSSKPNPVAPAIVPDTSDPFRLLAGVTFLLCTLILLAAAPMAHSQDEDGDKSKKRGEEAEKNEDEDKVDTAGNQVGAFGKFLPVGSTNEGVTIPSFDDGVRASLLRAKRMTRIDEDYLELDDLVIETFFPDGSTDSTISMLRARFHMPSSVMTSRSRSTVKRKDFEIEGDSLVFDTETQRGRMAGNVEMVIYDVKNFGAVQGAPVEGETSEDTGAKKPENAADQPENPQPSR